MAATGDNTAAPSAVSWWQRHLPQGTVVSLDEISAAVALPTETTQARSALGLDAGGTLPAVWHSIWTANPDRPVIHDQAHGWLSCGQLAASVDATASRLAQLGVTTGDRVLLSAPNSVELVVAHIALLWLGAVIMPVNPGFQRNEVERLIQHAQPRLALLDDSIHDTWRNWIAAASATTGAEVSSGTVAPKWSEVVAVSRSTQEASKAALPAPNLSPPNLSPQQGALLIYTSGSTGTPKAALLSHANLLASVRSIELAWRWSADDVLVLALPLSHMHGLGVGLYGSLTAGAKAVLHASFDAAAVFDDIATHSATLFFGVPTSYSRLLESPRVSEMAKLRLCVAGSAPLPAQDHQRFAELTGQQVLERYGMTETAMLVSNPYEGERRPGTVGFPLPGVELRLNERTSEIQVRGPNVFSGYWDASGNNVLNAQAFTDGWFHTGDIGEISVDGYVSIVGRMKEIIISGGYNIHPREVEEAVALHPAVAECAVGGEPDPKWGEIVVAYVVLDTAGSNNILGDPAAGLTELRAFLADRLVNYKRPQKLCLVQALPRNALGKVQRHLLQS